MTLMVFSFGLLPLITLFQRSHKVTAQAKNLMVAQSLGRTIIDEIRAYGFDGIEKNKSTLAHAWKQVEGPLVPSDPNSVKFPVYYRKFETMTTVTPYPDTNPDKYRICLTVKWVEPGRTGDVENGIERGSYSIPFGTVVVKYGAKYN